MPFDGVRYSVSVAVEVEVIRDAVPVEVDVGRKRITDAVVVVVIAAHGVGIRVVGHAVTVIVERQVGAVTFF